MWEEGMPFPVNKSIVANKESVSCNMDGEGVVLQLKTGVYFRLDDVGTFIWDYIQTPHTLREVHAAVMEEYEVSPEQCAADLSAFFQNLDEHELLETCNEEGA